MPSKVRSYEGKGVSTLLDWASGGCHPPGLLLWWLLLCRQRIGDQKRPVFDDFSPCRESHGEYFPGGIKSRAAVWRKLGSVHFLAFLWLLLCRQKMVVAFMSPENRGRPSVAATQPLCGFHTDHAVRHWRPGRPGRCAESLEARPAPTHTHTPTQNRYPALRGE